MRVIAGEFRSRILKSIPGLATRPTPDRLRETLFDILAPRIQGALFLDAYAGTGSVGIEALSRGARHALFLERSRGAIEVIRENLASLDLGTRATVVTGSVLLTLNHHPADIVFADPPYEQKGAIVRSANRPDSSEYDALLEALAELRPALAVVQHSTRRALPDTCRALTRTRMVKQGDNALSFYNWNDQRDAVEQ